MSLNFSINDKFLDQLYYVQITNIDYMREFSRLHLIPTIMDLTIVMRIPNIKDKQWKKMVITPINPKVVI